MGSFLPNYTKAYYSIGVSIVRCGVEAVQRCDRGIVEDAVDYAYHADNPRHEAQVMLLILPIENFPSTEVQLDGSLRWGMGDSRRRRANTNKTLQACAASHP